jgi:hypothetical protein
MGADRGQTTIDFAVGASLFLLGVAFVFTFVPGMLGPFTGGQSDVLVADRAAQQLSSGFLRDGTQPYVLDRDCTQEFFAGNTPAECDYTTTDLGALLGLDDATRINVTVRDGGSVASLDGVTLRSGDPLPGHQSAVAANRVVYVDGETYRLTVRVW